MKLKETKPGRKAGMSLTSTFMIWSMFILFVGCVSTGAFLIWNKHTEYSDWMVKIERKNLEEHKRYLRDETLKAVSCVKDIRDKMEKDLRQELKRTADFACETLDILHQSADTTIKARPEALVTLLSEAVGHFSQLGEFFIVDLSGTVIFSNNYDMPYGTNAYDLVNHNNQYYIRDIVDQARGSREGFYTYLCSKGNLSEGRDCQKLVYLKLYESFQWAIGVEIFLEDLESLIQQRTLVDLEKINYLNNGYLFASDWKGNGLLGPSKGKNNLNITDHNGMKVVQELIHTSQAGGGFVRYVMPAIDDMAPKAKISYVAPIKDWQWYIGAGLYLDDIDKNIQARSREIKSELRSEISMLLFVYSGTLLLALGLMGWLSQLVRSQIAVFSDFFNQAAHATNPEQVDVNRLRFSELKLLGSAANEMIMERRQLENELEIQNLRSLSLAKQATMANEAKSNFLARISHELKTPLNAILGFSEVLQQDGLDSVQIEYLNHIHKAGMDLDRLISDILLYSGMEISGLQCLVRDSSLPDLILLAKRRFESEAQAKGLGFKVSIKDRIPITISTDFDFLLQCLNQLLDNAVKFTDQGEIKVTIGAQKQGNRQFIQIEVSDTGIGISPEKVETIFAPFAQADERLNRCYEGAGIGLAVVKKIVDKLDGAITVKSELQCGSTFSLIIPDQNDHPADDIETLNSDEFLSYIANLEADGDGFLDSPGRIGIDTGMPNVTERDSEPEDLLISTLANDPDLGIVVTMFVGQDLPEFISRIRVALVGNDFEGLLSAVHDLKGTSGNAGFDQVCDRARELEKQLLDAGRIVDKNAIQSLVALCDRVTV